MRLRTMTVPVPLMLVLLFFIISWFYTPIKQVAKILAIYFMLKWIFSYRKCTISYLECKLRGVPKEEGYLNSFLEQTMTPPTSPRAAVVYGIAITTIML